MKFLMTNETEANSQIARKPKALYGNQAYQTSKIHARWLNHRLLWALFTFEAWLYCELRTTEKKYEEESWRSRRRKAYRRQKNGNAFAV